jgi:hypothetical protein
MHCLGLWSRQGELPRKESLQALLLQIIFTTMLLIRRCTYINVQV